MNYKNNKIAYSFSIRTENGIKNIVVNSIKIILAVRNILNDDIEIYIKFYIQNAKGIFVISFHESDK